MDATASKLMIAAQTGAREAGAVLGNYSLSAFGAIVLFILAYIAAGGDGCISSVSNVAPDLCVAVARHLREGRLYQARELHQRLVPLATLLEREHPAALKFALALLGFMQPVTRLPIVQLGTTAKAELAQAMAELADEYLAAAQ